MKDICGLIPVQLLKNPNGVFIFIRKDRQTQVYRSRIRCLPEPPVNIPKRVMREESAPKLDNIPPDANSIIIFKKGKRHIGLYAQVTAKNSYSQMNAGGSYCLCSRPAPERDMALW